MSRTYDVAVVGATGLVGDAMIRILEEREFPVGQLYPLASARSIGRSVEFRGESLAVAALDDFDFRKTPIAFFSAGGSVSAEHAPRAAADGAVVIDNTSHFRYDDDIPLVVPECNAHRIAEYSNRGIIANPNCSTIQMVVALKPFHDFAGIERINVATYQATSGAGRKAMESLTEQTQARLAGSELAANGGEKPVAFNAVPKIGELEDTGYTMEEMKLVWETRKILEDPDIMVNPTCVRIPVYFGHSEAVHIETRTKVTVPEARKLLNSAPGVKLLDGDGPGEYPTAATDAAHRDAVYIGRIREDLSHPRGLAMWVVADNVRKGAALNSVQIAEILVNQLM
ncbi:MAG TPA: aspartate-semialdehyde dehydrogenase [Gammaproteobacteria bacterium]